MVLGWVTAPPPPACTAATSAAAPSSSTLLPCSVFRKTNCWQNRRHRQPYRLQATTASCRNTGHVHDDDNDDDSATSPVPVSRGPFLWRLASSALAASVGFSLAPDVASSLDAQRDARTARAPPPALLLPVEKLRVAATNLTDMVKDPAEWEEARSLLRSPPLSQPDFSKILDCYSDSNWEKHILGDLHRNEGLASLKALDEVMAFALQQQASGVDVTQDDIDDVREAGRALVASLDDFLSLAPSADLQLVQKLVNQ